MHAQKTAHVALVVALVAAPVGAQGFGLQQVITTMQTPYSVLAADFDGDGDQDVLSASVGSYPGSAAIVWTENTDGLGTFGPQQVIKTAFFDWFVSAIAADLDGDGDQDVVSASPSFSSGEVAWHENTDGLGTFLPQQVITTATSEPWSVFAADLDGDGDQDVLSASYWDDKIAWYENIDSLGTFGTQQVITSAADGARSVLAADLDGDGDQDVLSASEWDDKVAWYENTDGLGTFGPPQVISNAADFANSVFASDLDGDGDRDVLYASFVDNTVAWHENADGLGTFGIQQTLSTSSYSKSVITADVDMDGDQDVLSPGQAWWPAAGDINWYENTDGHGTFGPPQAVGWGVYGPESKVFAADLDGDGVQDVLTASDFDGKIAWYENFIDPPLPLSADVSEISVALGGQQAFFLKAGMYHALRTYLLLGTTSGTEPGFPMDGLVLPLNPDSYFLYSLWNPNGPVLGSTFATLTAYGTASASFNLPIGLSPSLVGTTLHHAYGVFDLTSVPGQPIVSFVSNAVPLSLAP